jgi:hypothetical protein
VLRIIGFQSVGRELFDAEGASKKTTVIARRLKLNEVSVA